MLDFTDLRDKNIAILGFGLEGKSTLRFLMDQKVSFRNITILDTNKDLDSPDEVQKVTWEEHLRDLSKYDIIFKSSGVPITEQMLPYQDKIVTQVQLFFDTYPGKVIAVTASKGKSTITSLIYSLLRNAWYQVKLVGNIGTPVFDEIDICPSPVQDDSLEICPVSENDFIVIELSSYMLHNLVKKNYISILGTLFPEHLDRHGSFDKYIEAKLHILDGSEINIVKQETIAHYQLDKRYRNIIPYGLWSQYTRIGGEFVQKDKMIFSTDDRKIPWDHNLENIAAVIALADVLHISTDILHKTVSEFQGLPHRLEEVWVYGWIRRIDDAISTTPESTIAAIKTFGDQISTIFLGGTDRGYSFDELAKCIYDYKISNIVIFPDSGDRILKSLEHGAIDTLHILQTDDMRKAVEFAYQHTAKNSICLLSTASPSYSVRKNFEEKWDVFQKYIKEFSDS